MRGKLVARRVLSRRVLYICGVVAAAGSLLRPVFVASPAREPRIKNVLCPRHKSTLAEQMITRSRNLEGAIQAGKESLERFPSSQLCSDDSDDAANIAADIAAASRRGVAVARPRPVAGCSTPP